MAAPSFVRTMAITFGAIIGLFLIDTSLATVEKTQSQEDGKRAYEKGLALMKNGDAAGAIDQFEAAISFSRETEVYQLELGRAQRTNRQFKLAEQTLEALLERDGQDGAANLAMARTLAKEGNMPDAFSYYHRAIYGHWNENAPDHRLVARFELVDLIDAQKGREGLLAELLPLQAEAPDDPATAMKLASLFASAAAPARAATIYREVLQKNSANADAWDGLGDTEFTRGNFRPALTDFDNALRHRATDEHARQRADECREILATDPSQRGLGAAERLSRSARLLQLTVEAAGSCAPQELLDQTKKRVTEPEVNVDLATKIWKSTQSSCGASAPEYLQLTLNKLAQ
jgi:tetratricopeptide (TPR) repeat protein